jgi:hypothetical protein
VHAAYVPILFNTLLTEINLLPQVYKLVLLDLPGLLFFSAYTLLVLFWAEIYHQVLLLTT